jgi:hypothetical protein
MRPLVGKYLTLLEVLLFAAFVAAYIWRLQTVWPRTWYIFPAWLIFSLVVHRDTPKTMGWRGDNLWAATRQAAPVFGAFIAIIFVIGLFLGALHRWPVHLTDSHRFIRYFAFCLLQQTALNSYLMNRLLSVFDGAVRPALVASAIFGALHWPNPVLVPLTFAGGFAICWLFARQRNILPLTLGQAILGGLIFWAFPMAWHHSMRVGPGYYTFGR